MYGVLIKREEDYNFFSDFIQSNRDVISSCNALFLRNFTQRSGVLSHKHSQYSMDGEIFGPQVFWPVFLCCAILIVAIFVCGIAFEIKMRYHSCGHRKVNDGDSIND